MRLSIQNETRGRVPRGLVSSVARRAERLFRLPPYAHIDIVFVSDQTIRTLNRRTRHEDRPTDVLAFPLHHRTATGRHRRDPDGLWRLGDIIVSVETARRSAHARGVPARLEIAELVAHGVLHILGYDHGTKAERSRMDRLTRDLLGPRAALSARPQHHTG